MADSCVQTGCSTLLPLTAGAECTYARLLSEHQPILVPCTERDVATALLLPCAAHMLTHQSCFQQRALSPFSEGHVCAIPCTMRCSLTAVVAARLITRLLIGRQSHVDSCTDDCGTSWAGTAVTLVY